MMLKVDHVHLQYTHYTMWCFKPLYQTFGKHSLSFISTSFLPMWRATTWYLLVHSENWTTTYPSLSKTSLLQQSINTDPDHADYDATMWKNSNCSHHCCAVPDIYYHLYSDADLPTHAITMDGNYLLDSLYTCHSNLSWIMNGYRSVAYMLENWNYFLHCCHSIQLLFSMLYLEILQMLLKIWFLPLLYFYQPSVLRTVPPLFYYSFVLWL